MDLVKSSPLVFVTYAHDSTEHQDRVRSLVDELKSSGATVIVDFYVEAPPEGWEVWMAAHIKSADYVVVVCSKDYYEYAMSSGPTSVGRGVRFESRIIFADLYESGVVRKSPMARQGRLSDSCSG